MKMKELVIFLGMVMFGIANVCMDEEQEMGASVLRSIQIPGVSPLFLFNIVENPSLNVLYFIGYLKQQGITHSIILQSDPTLTTSKIMTYNFNGVYHSPSLDPAGHLIYLQHRSSSKIYEIQTSDLLVSRELTITSAKMDYFGHTSFNGFLYTSFTSLSKFQICRWNTTDTNVDCFSFGVGRPPNFVPISDDLLFMGSPDTELDQYYLIAQNFSDPYNHVWKKSIACPTSGCISKASASLLSKDKKSIYTMILYNKNFLFYKLNATDGSPQNPGFIFPHNDLHDSYSIKEFSTFIAIQIHSLTMKNQKRLVLVNLENSQILKEYKSVDSKAFGVGIAMFEGIEYMYHCGHYLGTPVSFFARTPIKNIDQLSKLEEDSPLFTKITNDYQVVSTLSIPNLTSTSQVMTIFNSTSIVATEYTSTITPSFDSSVALWNEDHIQSVQSDSFIKVNFTWACALSANPTDIAFSINQTDSHAIPKWVIMNVAKLELYLNKTPAVNVETTYYFSLKISFDSEAHYKRFEITVEECNIPNCVSCQLGDSSLCETCATGYQLSDNKKSCPEPVLEVEEVAAEVATAATALAASSAVIASASSLLSLSSVNSIFSTMNSQQLAVLLPTIPIYFPQKVSNLMSGTGFSMFSFSFLSIESIPYVGDAFKSITSPQTNEDFVTLGVKSKSCLFNLLSLIGAIILICVIHFWLLLIYKCSKKSKNKKCKDMCKKLFRYFTFSIYIRVLIQSFMFISLCILCELYTLSFETTKKKISSGICIAFALFCAIFILFTFWMYAKSSPEKDSEKSWVCTEFFNGIRPTKPSKLYSSIFMILRAFCNFLVVFGDSTFASQKTTYFYLCNIGYCLYLLIVRPFENPQDNLIEIINQILFCCMAVPLMWLKTESDWSAFHESYYIYIFMISPLIVCFICLAFLAKTIFICIKKNKCNRTSSDVAPKKTAVEELKAPQQPEEEEKRPNLYNSELRSEFSVGRSNAGFLRKVKNLNPNGLDRFRKSTTKFPKK